MKKTFLTSVAALTMVGLSAVPTAASAELFGNKNLSANLGFMTDYYFRGITQTANDPSFFAGLDYAHDSGFYVGTWAAGVDSNTYAGSTKEVDIYAGWAGEFAGVGVDVGVLRYMYPGDDTPNKNDTNEWHVGVSHDFGPVAASLTFNRSPDFYGLKEADYWDFGVEVPINDNWTAHAHYGITDYDKSVARGGGDDYKDASVGVGTTLGIFDLDLTVTKASDVSGGCGSQSTCKSRAILTISKSF